MGCWHSTDLVTDLPILAGEEVYMILMANMHRPDAGMPTYSVGQWVPVGLPIKGKYNDYGMIEDIVDPIPLMTQSMMFSLCKDTISEEGERRMKQDFEEGSTDLEKYLFSVERGHRTLPRSYLHRFTNDVVVMGFALINAEVYDRVVEECYSVMDFVFDHQQKSPKDIAKKMFDLLQNTSLDDVDRHFYFMDEHYPFCMSEGGRWVCSPKEWILSPKYNEVINEIYGANNPPTYDDILIMIEESVRFQKFIIFLSSIRKSFAPPPGAGSQSENFGAYKLVHQLAQKKMDRVEEGRE